MMRAPEKFRVRHGDLATTEANGPNGMFMCRTLKFRNAPLRVIASSGEDIPPETGIEPWEHVSVSTPNRCPTWEEMCWIKSIFWDEEDTVMQLHPPKSEWISNHAYCLHLWRPSPRLHIQIPRPPAIMVGAREAGTLYT